MRQVAEHSARCVGPLQTSDKEHTKVTAGRASFQVELASKACRCAHPGHFLAGVDARPRVPHTSVVDGVVAPSSSSQARADSGHKVTTHVNSSLSTNSVVNKVCRNPKLSLRTMFESLPEIRTIELER